jgi:hypothetical protein
MIDSPKKRESRGLNPGDLKTSNCAMKVATPIVVASETPQENAVRAFEKDLYPLWLRAGYCASPRPDGSGVTFLCPDCPNPIQLEIQDGWISCPDVDCTVDSRGEAVAIVAELLREHPPVNPPAIVAAPASSAVPFAAFIETDGKPFPLHCLPPAVASMARAIAATERTPESLAGCCVLAILSASIGAGLNVRSAPSRTTRANLFITASAESGSGKSETFRHAATPFIEFGQDAFNRWKTTELPSLEAERDILEAEIKKVKHAAGGASDAAERSGLKSDLEKKKAALAKVDAEMHPPMLYTEDVTTERLGVLLSMHRETLASLSADAGAVINNLLGRYSKLERTDESIYLKAFSGDPCRIDRQGRLPVELNSPCLTALWLVQPDKVETLLGERSLTEGGLIPRLLICHTNAEPRAIVGTVPAIPAAVYGAYRQTIRSLLNTYRLADEVRTVEVSPDASAVMIAHHNEIVERRKGDLRDVTTFAARWNEQAWRLSACLHAGAHGSSAHERALSIETVRAAIELAEWFSTQQLEILGAGRRKSQRKVWDGVILLLADHPEGIQASDVYRARVTRDAGSAHTLLTEMHAAGELVERIEQPQRGGHATKIYTPARP